MKPQALNVKFSDRFSQMGAGVVCSRRGCTRRADWTPVLLVFAPAEYKCNASIKIQLALRFCDQCMAGVKLEELVDDAAWADVARIITGAGFVEPDLSLTALSWVRWQGSMMQRFKAHAEN